MTGIRIAAPAKLNLYLHVVGRRADGYHLLDSLVAFADIGDVVEACRAEHLSLEVTGPFADGLDGDDNLVLRAARALGPGRGAALRLEKNLPVASGIGGGSSDAAAALLALSRLWDVPIPPDLPIALGADVPACLLARSAWLGGIGEDVAPAPPLPSLGVVLVNPRIALSTPAVFKARQGPFSEAARFDPAGEAAGFLAQLAARRNDLAAAAASLVPEIGAVLASLEGSRLARMSGSGATCFGLYEDVAAARAAAARIARPGWWVAAGKLASRPPPEAAA